MYTKAKILILGLLGVLTVTGSYGQQSRSKLDSLYDELVILLSDDSLSIENLLALESKLALENPKFSSLSLHMGYINQMVNSGRELGLDQFGLSAGASYTGVSLDISGYYSQDYRPSYYMTALNIGYWRTLKNTWNISLGHDFYLYNDPETSVFNKSAIASVSFSKKVFDLGLDYRFLYGDETAHRVIGSAHGYIRKKDLGFIDRISLQPGFSVYFGNANVIYFRQSETPVLDLYRTIAYADNFPYTTARQVRKVSHLLDNDRQLAATFYLRNIGYTDQQISQLFDAYQTSQFRESNVFGLMNYALSLSVSASAGRWNAHLCYTYNFPVSLAGEDIEYPDTGYLSASLGYTILWY